MAIGTLVLTTAGKEALLSDNASSITWTSATVRAVLLTAAYTPDVDHSAFSNISANQITDVGYSAVTLSNKTSNVVGGKILWDCDNISFGNTVTLTAKYLALVNQAGGSLSASDIYLGYIDLNVGAGQSAVSSNSSFVINTPNGLFEV
jgi:hypothetical protein